MKLSRIFLCLLTVLIASCGNPQTAPKNTGGPISPAEIDTIKAVNQSLNDHTAALSAAFGGGARVEVSEKAQKLANMLSGKCPTHNLPTPPDDTSKNWDSTQEVSGAGCPIRFEKQTSFNLNSKTITVNHQLSVNKAYSDASGLGDQAARGFVQAFQDKKGRLQVQGRVEYLNLEIAGIGNVHIDMVVSQVTQADGVQGAVRCLIRIPGHPSHLAIMAWSGTTPVFFRVDSTQLDAKSFQEMFSAFGLSEIMANALKLR